MGFERFKIRHGRAHAFFLHASKKKYMVERAQWPAFGEVKTCMICDAPRLRLDAHISARMDQWVEEWSVDMCDAMLRKLIFVRVGDGCRRMCTRCARTMWARKRKWYTQFWVQRIR